MAYIDGFVIPIPRRNLPAYRRMAARAGKIWLEHGALQFIESTGDDLQTQHGVPFPKLARAKPGETVLFSFIVYTSRAHRDRVNKRVMSDPRIGKMMSGKAKMPFDDRRMTWGGFKSIVALPAGRR